MEQHIRRLQTSDRETAMQEAKRFGERIRASFEAEGLGERGAAAQQQYYRLLGMPDLDKMRDPFEKITPQLQRMYALRMANAERMQTAVERTTDATERGVRSVQASTLYALPITEAFELVGDITHHIAEWLESWEDLIDKAGDALDKNKNANSGFWFELFKKLGLAGGRTREDEITEQYGPAGPSQNMQQPPTMPRTRRLPLPGGPGAAVGGTPQQFAGGNNAGGTGQGVGLGVGGAVDRLPEEYEEIGGAMIEDRRGDVFPGRQGDPVEDNTAEMENLAYELRRLNDFLAPSNIMNPAFHNAPMGGAAGESNPMQLPEGSAQPGGGAASEAAQAARAEPQSRVARSMSEAMKYLEKNEFKACGRPKGVHEDRRAKPDRRCQCMVRTFR